MDNKDELVVIKWSGLLQLLKDVIEDGNIRDEEINQLTFPASEVFDEGFKQCRKWMTNENDIRLYGTAINDTYTDYEQTKLK